jgi:rhodanese-related sulfurtransferase
MRTIETSELNRMLEQKEDLVLINVLDAESFEQEHIPGSHNVPSHDLNLVGEVERLAGRKDRRIVVYCANPQCHASPHAGERLERASFSNVVHYPGGMEGWKSAGHDVEHGAPAHRS